MTPSGSPFIDSLDRLSAPAHAEDFYHDLWRRIEREAQRAKPRRLARFSRLTSPRRVRFAAVPIAAAAIAVVVAVVALSGLPGLRGTQPEPATATSVGASIGRAMQSWQTFEATMLLRSDMSSDYPSDPVTARVHVALSSSGGERWDWLSVEGPTKYRQQSDTRKGDAEAYDPETHQNQIYRRRGSEDGRPSLLVAEGAFPASLGPLQPYAAAARAMLAEQDPDAPVRRVLVDGRPAWCLDLSQPGDEWSPRISRDGDFQAEELVPRGFDVSSQLVVTVDAATGMPLRMIGRDSKGRVVGELRLEDVSVNVRQPAGIFRLDPAGAQVERVTSEPDLQAVSLSEVEATTGHPPLVPSRIPSGYSLATVCVVHRYRKGVAVELFYRRGLDVFVVATGPQGFRGWGDQLSWVSLRDRVSELGQGYFWDKGDGLSWLSLRDRVSELALPSDLSAPLREQKSALTAGALAGRQVSTTISSRWAPGAWRGPSLWTTDAGSRLVITGTLTRTELIGVAESLEPWGE